MGKKISKSDQRDLSVDPHERFASYDECLDFILGKAREVIETDPDYVNYDADCGLKWYLEPFLYLEPLWDDEMSHFRCHWYRRAVLDVSSYVRYVVYRVVHVNRGFRKRGSQSVESVSKRAQDEFLSHFPEFSVNTKWAL